MIKVPKTTLPGFCLCAMALAFLTDCALDPNYNRYAYENEGHGYPMEWRHDPNASTAATLEYQPPELLAQNEIDAAKQQGRPPDLSQVPKGGRVTVHLHGHNSQGGNPSNYKFVVADKDGNVLKQEESGPDRPASASKTSKASPPSYEGYHTIDLETPVKDQVKVNVVNKTDNSKEEYTISHPSYKPPQSTPSPAPAASPAKRVFMQ